MKQAIATGSLSYLLTDKIARLSFSHPKGNSLPLSLILQITEQLKIAEQDSAVHVIILQSEPNGDAFCGGAYLTELKNLSTISELETFFQAFADLLLAIHSSSKFVLCRVHGKAVGGGVGIIAAADYALALKDAAVRLSEAVIGFGPFVIAPSVEAKIGNAALMELTLDSCWKDSEWCRTRNLFSNISNQIEQLDLELTELASRLAKIPSTSASMLKSVLAKKNNITKELLYSRATISAQLFSNIGIK
jgi:methylglutaconyl-CoA hydratase